MADFDAMGEMVKKIQADHGPVDILVNCAGITRDSTFRKMTPDQWRAVLSTNLDSVFNVTRHVIDGNRIEPRVRLGQSTAPMDF